MNAQQTGILGVCFSGCKKLIRMFIIATINIMYTSLICGCLFKRRQSRTVLNVTEN
jgi:hypothetical protein